MESDGYFEVKFLSAKDIFRLFNMKRVRLIFTFHRQVWRQKGKMIIVCDQAESCKSIAVERNTNTKLTVCEFILLDRQIGTNKLWKVTGCEGAYSYGMSKALTQIKK